MNKQEFLERIRNGLKGLPKDETDEQLAFFSEMISDRIEDGVSEETAVSELGDIDALVSQIIADIPLKKIVKEKIVSGRKPKAWETVLIVLDCPVWLPLLITALAVVLSLYVILWSVIIALWALFASFAACGAAGIAAGVYFAVNGHVLTGIATVGAGMVCIGLSVFVYYGCKAATKGILRMTEKLVLRIKNRIVKKEEA